MAKARANNTVLSPERYALSGSEDAHQISLFMWASHPDTRAKYPELEWLFAIPNGGLRNKATAGRMRAMGLKAGVPDIMLPIRRGKWSGLVIELKRPKIKRVQAAGKVRDEQVPWLNHFLSQGYGACACEGWTVARDVIIQYLEYKE